MLHIGTVIAGANETGQHAIIFQTVQRQQPGQIIWASNE